MDGVLEAVYNVFDSRQNMYKQFNLLPANYYINLLEVSYFDRNALSDANITRYWYSYQYYVLQTLSNLEEV